MSAANDISSQWIILKDAYLGHSLSPFTSLSPAFFLLHNSIFSRKYAGFRELFCVVCEKPEKHKHWAEARLSIGLLTIITMVFYITFYQALFNA